MASSMFFVALWLLPLTIFLLLPLAICFGWLGYRCIRDVAAGEIPFIEYFSRRYYVQTEVQRRREARRAIGDQLSAIITAGNSTFQGVVADVSTMGLGLAAIPDAIPATEPLVSVLIEQGKEQVQLVARPCWQLGDSGSGRRAGLEIADCSPSWSEFVYSRS